MKYRVLVVLLFCVFSLKAQEQTEKHLYKRVKISNVDNSTIEKLDIIGIDLTCGASISDDKLQLELNETELHKLDGVGITYTILVEDLTKFYSERAVVDLPKARLELNQMKLKSKALKSKGIQAKSVYEKINNVGQYTGENEIDWDVPTNWNLNPNSSPNTFGGGLTYAMVLQELDDMKTLYPNLISARANASPSNQKTIENRTVWMVRISDNPETDEPNEPETLYQSLIHSREIATVMNQLYFMWYLLENYDSDPAIKNLINNQELYFIPVFNPDGFVYNQTRAPNGGGMQRKNRNTSAPSSCSEFLDGIDLNRNSEYYWGNGGSETDPCKDTYMGTAPFSENETQIMKDFFLLHNFKLALNHHSYKNAMLHAYAGTAKIPNPRPDEYAKYSHDFSFYNRYLYGPSSSITSINSGNMNDWMLGGPLGKGKDADASVQPPGTPVQPSSGSGKNTMSWTPENGSSAEGGFWPSPSNFIPIAKRAMRMNFMAAYFSGKYAKLHDMTTSNITANGNFTFGLENLGQTASNFTVTVTPISGIATVGSAVTETGMSVLEQKYVNIPFTLSSGIQANDKVEYKVILTNDYATDNVLYEANIVKYYNPATKFSDNPDLDNLTKWTANGGSWYVTNSAHSGTKAIATTNSFPYSNNINKTLQMNGFVDLTNTPTTVIQYYAKWDLERSFDYVQIEASTSGTSNSWLPLHGKYTKPGSPNAAGNTNYSGVNYDSNDTEIEPNDNVDDNFQPDWEPLYDGDTQDKWVMEEIVIDGSNNAAFFNNSKVYLRFQFRTDPNFNRKDSYVNADFEGFTFDDFKVLGLTEFVCTDIVSSFPYSESFENTIGKWNQSNTDDIEWTVDRNGTPSTGTGPSSANDGDYYIYTEASDAQNGFPQGNPNKVAELISPCFDFAGYKNAEINFDYHTLGTDLGSIEIQISEDKGENYITLNTPTIATSSSWKTENIFLPASYNGKTIKLKIIGTTGSGYSSDLAIDNFSIAAEVDNTLGIQDELLNTFSLYPNPSDIGEIRLKMPNEIQEFNVNISNILGQKLYTNTLNNYNTKPHTISTQGFKTGVYFVSVSTPLGKSTKKLVIE